MNEGRTNLVALNAAFLKAFEAAGFDCDDRYTPHVTMMKVSRIGCMGIVQALGEHKAIYTHFVFFKYPD